MGKIRYYIQDEGLSFQKPSEEFTYVSYEECLSFLEHLRIKGRLVDRHVVRGLFSSHDFTDSRIQLLTRIKGSASAEEAYDNYGRECQKANPNCNHKFMPELDNIYRDDLYEYLLSEGVEEAEKIAMMIANKEYKQYRRSHPMVLSEEFDKWALGCCFLPSRSAFMKKFPTEYGLYQVEKEFGISREDKEETMDYDDILIVDPDENQEM